MPNEEFEIPKRKDETSGEPLLQADTPVTTEAAPLTEPAPTSDNIFDAPVTETPASIPTAEPIPAVIEPPITTETPVTPEQPIITENLATAPTPEPLIAPEAPVINLASQTDLKEPDTLAPAEAFPVATEAPALETAAPTLEPAPAIDTAPATEVSLTEPAISNEVSSTEVAPALESATTFDAPTESGETPTKDKKLKKKLQKEKQIQAPTEEKKKGGGIAGFFTLLIIIAIIIAAVYFFVSKGIIELPAGFNLPFLSTTKTMPIANPDDSDDPTIITLPGTYKEASKAVCADNAATLILNEDNTFIFKDVKLVNSVCEVVPYEGTYTALDGVLTLIINDGETEINAEYIANQVTVTIVLTGTAGVELTLYKAGV